jgi:hypothetical protein
MWQAAPIVAAAALCVSILGYLADWPAAVPLVCLGAGILGLLLFFIAGRRSRAVGDADASTIDRDAGLAGELRSAHWFAVRDPRDEWADFHIQRAAARLSGVDWAAQYPPFPARRARLATAALALAALVLALAAPAYVAPDGAAAEASGRRTSETATGARGEPLPPELQRKLEELLAAVERGELQRAASLGNDPALASFLQGLTHLRDRELLEALSRALSSKTAQAGATSVEDMEALAERARRAAEAAPLAEDMKSALEKLAGELDLVTAESPTRAGADGAQDGQAAQGEGPAGAGSMDQVSIQFAEGTDAGGGQSIVMMPSDDGANGAGSPGAGVGGSGSGDAGAPAASAELAAALRRETVEASDDRAGANVESDVRRKTEHGDAALSYTGSATRTFDSTRAVAPPPLPETRRTGVKTYFLRTP